MTYRIVGANIDTLYINVKGTLDEELAEELNALKLSSQFADEDVPTPWVFAGETLFIKAHGSGRQWKWILHCPSLHLDIGEGKLNQIIGRARLSAVYLWESEIGDTLATLYDFLSGFYGERFLLQVSELHLCADITGWEPSLLDAHAFITRGHKRKLRLDRADDDNDVPTSLDINMDGRRCTGYDISKSAPHSCCIYDKTREIVTSRKDWMEPVWESNGWDGASRVIRVEFRYERECLKELGIEDPYVMLDQLPGLWAYSTQQWLRHTIPTHDKNRGRWATSPFWVTVQQADFYCSGTPAVRERKHKGDLTLICQMLSGCSTTAAAYLAQTLPEWDDGANFLSWFMTWQDGYLTEKETTFHEVRVAKQVRLGIMPAA
jgi:hypothetical protein